MREPKIFKIGDDTFTIIAMEPEEGLPVFIWMTRIVGETLGESVAGVNGVEKMMDLDLDQINIGSAMKMLASRMDEKEVLSKIKTLLDGRYVSRTSKRGEGGPIEMADFAGEYDLMFKVLAKVLEVNYGRFLSGLKTAFSNAMSPETKKRKGSTQGS